jgi:hypothetical protein
MVEQRIKKLHQLTQMKMGPKYLRMDNAGENRSLADRMKHKDWKLPIMVDSTARDTPHQNPPVEVGFSTLSGRARAMLQEVNVPKDMRKLLMRSRPPHILTV